MSYPGGLTLFQNELHPQAVAEVLAWRDDAELGALLAKLQSHTARKAFFDAWAEAMVARRLRRSGCTVRLEVPTPSDRRVDFEVRHERGSFCLHLKRIDSDRPVQRRLAISSRLRVLERIRRPYIVQVRWHEKARDEEMQTLVTEIESFLQHAKVGDEMRSVDGNGAEIGGARVLAPSTDEHVSVTIGLPAGFVDHSPRMHRLLHRAHEQFMPRCPNVIMICSSHDDDAIDFEAALLGSHIERWDRFPPRGRRVAHGRAADGFWSGHRFADSQFAVWGCLSPSRNHLRTRLYQRQINADAGMASLLQLLFADDQQDADEPC